MKKDEHKQRREYKLAEALAELNCKEVGCSLYICRVRQALSVIRVRSTDSQLTR